MKVWRGYSCDFGHSWETYKDESQDDEEDHFCPQGHEAVQICVQPHADRTLISLLPATCVVDKVKNQTWFDDRYFVVISRIDGSDERRSEAHYSWSKAITIAERFRNKAFDRSLSIWERSRP